MSTGTNCVRCAAGPMASSKDRTAAVKHGARGLCTACHARCTQDGTLDDYPLTHRRRSDVIEDWEFLRDNLGLDRSAAAARLGMTRGALDKAIERHARPRSKDQLQSAVRHG